MKRLAIGIMVMMMGIPQFSLAQDKVAMAKSLFEEYIRKGESFDASIADLYSDDAIIRNTRHYPDGNKKEIAIPPQQYKQLIRTAMPLAKARNDISKYSDVTYAVEGEGVRIRAERYSTLKKYTSPAILYVAPVPGGKWLIFEEITESRP